MLSSLLNYSHILKRPIIPSPHPRKTAQPKGWIFEINNNTAVVHFSGFLLCLIYLSGFVRLRFPTRNDTTRCSPHAYSVIDSSNTKWNTTPNSMFQDARVPSSPSTSSNEVITNTRFGEKTQTSGTTNPPIPPVQSYRLSISPSDTIAPLSNLIRYSLYVVLFGHRWEASQRNRDSHRHRLLQITHQIPRTASHFVCRSALPNLFVSPPPPNQSVDCWLCDVRSTTPGWEFILYQM